LSDSLDVHLNEGDLMSAATVDSPTEGTARRSGANRSRPVPVEARRDLVLVREHTETAITDVITAVTDVVRAFLPAAVLRPTEAVDFTFDMAEQGLAASRRLCVEIASVLESGLQGVERRPA
jgi:hypothetical protein